MMPPFSLILVLRARLWTHISLHVSASGRGRNASVVAVRWQAICYLGLTSLQLGFNVQTTTPYFKWINNR